ncbi:MAG: DUF2309 domain-containing protein [Deltaproteobacteria bacterium]|nr:DUF2309 domain-containing protein [Deltaproteobacteria bacterium]
MSADPSESKPDFPTTPQPASERDDLARKAEHAIEHAGHLLPAQGPISVFIHHNTLHAFEDRPFEQAVVEAGELFGCEPFLSEARYREEHLRGRIHEVDIRAVLERDVDKDGAVRLGNLLTRSELRLTALHQGIETIPEVELLWLIEETGLIREFRADAPKAARHRVVEGFRRGLARWELSLREERDAVRALWNACRRAASRRTRVPVANGPRGSEIRHRDILLSITGRDCDELVHPFLIRVCAAFCDQGIAYWPMPGRERGLFASVLELHGTGPTQRGDWMDDLTAELGRERDLDPSPLESIVRSLHALGVDPADWDSYISRTLLALRGWAGIIRTLEHRPDLWPVQALPARLADFLAVRLIADRAALRFLMRREGLGDDPARLRAQNASSADPDANRASPHQDAYSLFQIAQLVGRSAREIDRLTGADVAEILGDLETFSGVERRRLLHQAYERRYRIEILDALAKHSAPGASESGPRFQLIACIDEREESLRRHLEEIEPDCETFGAAGFFGVAMYYRGASEVHPRPLCPVVVKPIHEIHEHVALTHANTARLRRTRARALARLQRGFHVGSRTLTRGAILTALLGAFTAIPLTVRVLFPRAASAIRHAFGRVVRIPARTELTLEPDETVSPMFGERVGYDPHEMADIVEALLRQTGLAARFSRLVVIAGHGSSSLNNPHESAHDCGACGGGRGGPNARAFALMANRSDVRFLLIERGLTIPEDTLFVGAEHNSCNDDIRFFDEDLIPTSRREEYEAATSAIRQACARNAHERCRRFEHADFNLPAAAAVQHVEARTEDLAQPRPEYGHATNAVCIVGRRARTRGLFLDRRAFLVSYDPLRDDAEGHTLERVLAAVAPVCAGINLEYYFSYVDPTGYGCGTKLPHNITGMLGVMDGHASDLRTGLPWQMVEIHEPVRLLMVVENDPALVRRVLDRLPAVRQLVTNRWMILATLAPQSSAIYLFDAERGEFNHHVSEGGELPVVESSLGWYAGRSDHLGCASVRSSAGAT